MQSDDFDWLRLQKLAHGEFSARVDAITDWDAATPDTEWTVRDLVRHVVEEQQWVPQLLAGRTVAQAKRHIEPLRDDLRSEWRLYSFAATEAWEGSTLDSLVHLSYDRVPVADYLREQTSDVAIHAWDLARAVGANESLHDDLIAGVWTVFEPQRDTLAASGLYAPAVPIPDTAPLQDRLLALTGRDPALVVG